MRQTNKERRSDLSEDIYISRNREGSLEEKV